MFRSLLAALLCCVAQITIAQSAAYEAGMKMLDAGDYSEALKYFGRAAGEGDSDAQYQLGLMYLDGVGVKTNPEDAAYWFRKAAQNGHTASQFEIGYCFATGTGVQQDLRIAGEWYWRAAEKGDPDAAFYLARLYRDGVGMPRNIEKARYYYAQAAKAGLPEAAQELEALPAQTPAKIKPATPAPAKTSAAGRNTAMPKSGAKQKHRNEGKSGRKRR